MSRPDDGDLSAVERLLGRAGPASEDSDVDELGCDACFDLLDEYVELELADFPADERIPGMRPHLAGCPACREEHDALLELASSE